MNPAFPTPDQNELLLTLIGKKLNCEFPGGQCLAIMDADRIVGVVVYFNHRGPNIECAIYSDDPRWMVNRDLVATIVAYPFLQLKCRRITALVEKANKRSRKMLQGMGFVEEGKLRKGGEDGDIFLYGLLPEDYKLRKYRGQEVSTSRTQAA